MDRKIIAENDKARNAYGVIRNNSLSTLVSIERYRENGEKTLQDLDESHLNKDDSIGVEEIQKPFQGVDKKIQILYYKEFTLYHLEKNFSGSDKKIPLN